MGAPARRSASSKKRSPRSTFGDLARDREAAEAFARTSATGCPTRPINATVRAWSTAVVRDRLFQQMAERRTLHTAGVRTGG